MSPPKILLFVLILSLISTFGVLGDNISGAFRANLLMKIAEPESFEFEDFHTARNRAVTESAMAVLLFLFQIYGIVLVRKIQKENKSEQSRDR